MKYYMRLLLFECSIFGIWLKSMHSHATWSWLPVITKLVLPLNLTFTCVTFGYCPTDLFLIGRSRLSAGCTILLRGRILTILWRSVVGWMFEIFDLIITAYLLNIIIYLKPVAHCANDRTSVSKCWTKQNLNICLNALFQQTVTAVSK